MIVITVQDIIAGSLILGCGLFIGGVLLYGKWVTWRRKRCESDSSPVEKKS